MTSKDNTTIKEEILQLPKSIHQMEYDLLLLNDNILAQEENLKSQELVIYQKIEEEIDPLTEKKRYSNEQKRQAELKKRLETNGLHRQSSEELKNKKRKMAEMRISLDTLKRKFRAYEAILKNV